MANKRITELNAASSITGSELAELVQGGTNVKSTVNAIWNPAPFDVGTQAGSITLNRANGVIQKMVINNTTTILSPSGGTEGLQLKLWVTPTTNSQSFSVDTSSILIPTDSAISFPKTLTQDKLYIMLFQHNGTNWMLNSLIGGY